MVPNLMLMIAGLIVCFGGIYLRRICSGVLGFFCGVIGAFLFIFFTDGIWGIDDDSMILVMIICGIICAIISSVYYKACIAISSFLLTFVIIGLFLIFVGDIDSGEAIITIATIIALIVAGISIKFYDYSFIITNTVIGAFVVAVGGFGLINDYDLGDTLSEILWEGLSALSPIILSTLVLSIIGFWIQFQKLKQINSCSKSSR